MNHHTKDKGDLGVLKAKVNIHQQGWTILTPETEHAPFDIVAYKNQEFRRIQVKYRKLVHGVLPVRFRRSWSDKNGVHVKAIDKEQVDIWCIYCPDTDQCYYIDPKKFNTTAYLRVADTLIAPTPYIHWAIEFTRLE